ncbi:MAG: hypothetical protein COB98_11830 [Flavobacteriaceae bacterium]|nr:MAG: hypothetical protein COB98_11830 [Flavobacteriaceae bacterium]
MKKTLLIDMDGVLAENDAKNFKSRKYDIGYFINKKPIPGAVEAFQKLTDKFDCHIVSTPVWGNPNCWSEKRLWVEKHLGSNAYKKLTLTHNKQQFKGDFIIDDTENYGVGDFEGEHIHFGQGEFKNWESVLSYLL